MLIPVITVPAGKHYSRSLDIRRVGERATVSTPAIGANSAAKIEVIVEVRCFVLVCITCCKTQPVSELTTSLLQHIDHVQAQVAMLTCT